MRFRWQADMTDSRKPFRAFEDDVDDLRLERLAEEKGVATMVRPSQETGQGGEHAAPAGVASRSRDCADAAFPNEEFQHRDP